MTKSRNKQDNPPKSDENITVQILSLPLIDKVTFNTKLGYRVGRSFKADCTSLGLDPLFKITSNKNKPFNLFYIIQLSTYNKIPVSTPSKFKIYCKSCFRVALKIVICCTSCVSFIVLLLAENLEQSITFSDS